MSLRLYRLLLRAYPAGFRRRWEDAMLDTFARQLADDGPGAWLDAFSDLVRVAFAQRVADRAVVVPFASLAGTCALFYGLIWSLENSLRLQSLYHLVTRR
jgi:hypothetical protein